MSLARAITKRMRRGDESSSSRFGRNNTVRHTPIAHGTISSPVALLSTTNVHALSAPDLPKAPNNSSSASSTHSSSESDFSSMIDRSFQTMTGEGSSTPSTPITPPMSSDKGFFEPTVSEAVPEVPQLPQRCASHSKKAHVELSRKRSIQRMSPPPTSLTRATSVRDSAAMFSSSIQEEAAATESQAHPFGAELAKVNELAEDFGSSNIVDEEERFMASQGLCKFGVQDYIEEIAGLYGGIYENNLGMAANPWLYKKLEYHYYCCM